MKKLLHGSANNDITCLYPSQMWGNNGTTRGTGIYLTDSPERAIQYAGDAGSVYMVNVDTQNYLVVNDTQTLSKDQSSQLQSLLKNLDKSTRFRLATDICGMQSKAFDCQDAAEAFYREHKAQYKALGLTLDRLKPDIDYDNEGRMIILFSHEDFGLLHTVPTSKILHRICLLDNSLSSHLFSHVCDGLEIQLDAGHKEFLSFAKALPIHRRLDQEFLSKPNAKRLLGDSVKQKEHLAETLSP